MTIFTFPVIGLRHKILMSKVGPCTWLRNNRIKWQQKLGHSTTMLSTARPGEQVNVVGTSKICIATGLIKYNFRYLISKSWKCHIKKNTIIFCPVLK